MATTMYLSATADAKKRNCRAVMQIIANSEEEYKIRSSASPRAFTTNLANLASITPAIPPCPNGGMYTIMISDGTATAQNGQTVPIGGVIISCSASGHGKFALNVDSN